MDRRRDGFAEEARPGGEGLIQRQGGHDAVRSDSACASLLAEGESFTTLELKINFLRPVRNATLEARAKVVHPGKAMVYLECEVVSVPNEKLVAKVSSTCLILRGDAAKGR